MDSHPITAKVWVTVGWYIPLILLIDQLKSLWFMGHIDKLLMPVPTNWRLAYRCRHSSPLTTLGGAMRFNLSASILATNHQHLPKLNRCIDATIELQCPKCDNTQLISTVKIAPKNSIAALWRPPFQVLNNAEPLMRTGTQSPKVIHAKQLLSPPRYLFINQ
jgi:hypothetical protein